MASVAVRFSGLSVNRSLESAVHRWVARLEVMRFAIRGADVVIESSKRRTVITVLLLLDTGSTFTHAAAHEDPYVAIADAFRAVRQRMLARGDAHVMTR